MPQTKVIPKLNKIKVEGKISFKKFMTDMKVGATAFLVLYRLLAVVLSYKVKKVLGVQKSYGNNVISSTVVFVEAIPNMINQNQG